MPRLGSVVACVTVDHQVEDDDGIPVHALHGPESKVLVEICGNVSSLKPQRLVLVASLLRSSICRCSPRATQKRIPGTLVSTLANLAATPPCMRHAC